MAVEQWSYHQDKQKPLEAVRPTGPFALEQEPLALHLQAVQSAEPFALETVDLEAVEVEMCVGVAVAALSLEPGAVGTVHLCLVSPHHTATAELPSSLQHQIVKSCPPPCL